MREIKFRVYIKNKNIMTEVKSLHLGTRKVIIGYSKSKSNYGNYSVSFDDIELMQYTGLKDKNGKEIYEGDILEDEEIRIKVLYELDGFYGQIIKLKKVCGTEVGLKYPLSFFQDDGNYLEVIGNTYDNTELLGGNNY